MKIRFQQSNGSTSLARSCDLVADDLQAEARKSLLALLREAQHGSRSRNRASRARDATCFHLDVESDGRHTVLTFDDQTVPVCALPLFEALDRLATPDQP